MAAIAAFGTDDMATTFDAKRRFGLTAAPQIFGGKCAEPTQLSEHGKDKDDDQKE